MRALRYLDKASDTVASSCLGGEISQEQDIPREVVHLLREKATARLAGVENLQCQHFSRILVILRGFVRSRSLASGAVQDGSAIRCPRYPRQYPTYIVEVASEERDLDRILVTFRFVGAQIGKSLSSLTTCEPGPHTSLCSRR